VESPTDLIRFIFNASAYDIHFHIHGSVSVLSGSVSELAEGHAEVCGRSLILTVLQIEPLG